MSIALLLLSTTCVQSNTTHQLLAAPPECNTQRCHRAAVSQEASYALTGMASPVVPVHNRNVRVDYRVTRHNGASSQPTAAAPTPVRVVEETPHLRVSTRPCRGIHMSPLAKGFRLADPLPLLLPSLSGVGCVAVGLDAACFASFTRVCTMNWGWRPTPLQLIALAARRLMWVCASAQWVWWLVDSSVVVMTLPERAEPKHACLCAGETQDNRRLPVSHRPPNPTVVLSVGMWGVLLGVSFVVEGRCDAV